MSASEMDAEQVAQFVAMRQEMDDMRLCMAQMEAVKKVQAEQKLFARKAAIKAECDKYTNKVRVCPGLGCPPQAVKRNVKVQMEGMDFLTDLEEVWTGMVDADVDGTGVIKVVNVEEANENLHKMTAIMKKFRESLQWEFNMQVMGATSNIQWGAVSQAELKRERDGLTHAFTLTPEEVRKYEQDKLTYDRQLRLAGVGSSRGGGGGMRGGAAAAAYGDIWLDGCAPSSSNSGYAPQNSGRGRRGRGRGGRGGGAPGGAAAGQKPGKGVKCYKCEGPHYMRDCPKQPTG